jgi:hypothetical protein
MEKKPSELKLGVMIFVILAVLTGVEFIVGVALLPTLILWAIALLKAGLVIWFFMHIRRVFRSQGGH